MIRTLAARWFQYSRESGDKDEAAIEELLRAMASKRPSYYLPPSAVKGATVKQYQPISEHSWSDPDAGSGAVKRAKTTLFPDPFFVVNPNEPIIWQWLDLNLGKYEAVLLAELLSRITYFGRAESVSHLRVTVRDNEPNCVPTLQGGNAPVLCFSEGVRLNIESVLGASDRGLLKNSPVPPGTEWVYYRRPEPDRLRAKPKVIAAPRVNCVQFALGGHVLPRVPAWIKVTERFRGRTLRNFEGHSSLLPLLSGKSIAGQPLRGEHDHTFYFLWPEEHEESPARLIAWRKSGPFHEDEIDAMMLGGSRPIPWTDAKEGWVIQMVPLPKSLPLPKRFCAKAKVWESVTPFVRPHSRHFRRPNGKTRVAEEPEPVCASLIEKVWGIRPVTVERFRGEAPWVKLHETAAMRKERREGERRTPHAGPGYYFRVTFAEEFQGPLIVGDSSHFGLGVFGAADS